MQKHSRRDSYNAIQGEPEFFVVPLLRKEIRITIEHFTQPSLEQSLALDIGAGECPLEETIEELGFNYFALDVEQNSTHSIDYVTPIDQQLPANLSAHQFDLIICTEVLEHVVDWHMAFKNIKSLLKPHAIAIFTAPFLYIPHEEPHDYWRPTEHSLKYFASQYQFSVEEFRRLGIGWETLGTVLCSISVCRRRKTFLAYFLVLPIYLLHFLLKTLLKTQAGIDSVEIQTELYLSNLVVLRNNYPI